MMDASRGESGVFNFGTTVTINQTQWRQFMASMADLTAAVAGLTTEAAAIKVAVDNLIVVTSGGLNATNQAQFDAAVQGVNDATAALTSEAAAAAAAAPTPPTPAGP